MDWLRKCLDQTHHHFKPGSKFEKFYPIYEMLDTFLYSPDTQTTGETHLRDAIDLKRMMITVAVALLPCIWMSLYNTGLQTHLALSSLNAVPSGWRADIMNWFALPFDPSNWIANVVHGALYFFPVFLVCNMAGGLVEVIFAIYRKHEINEGFLVTGMLFPLTLPPTIPLWQVAVAIIFAVVFGKEVFGGTGKNFVNIALLARAFLYFAYPAQISGDQVWVAVEAAGIDGFSMATPLSQVAATGPSGISVNWQQAFLGLMPGSMGETSALACLIGAGILVLTGVGSWVTILSTFVGLVATIFLFNQIGSTTNPAFALTPSWHLVIGGFAFGAVFMATDPVSSALTQNGKWAYGLLIGFMTAVIRVVNPAFPEGIMLAILFGNIFAPLIDFFVVQNVITRRRKRYE